MSGLSAGLHIAPLFTDPGAPPAVRLAQAVLVGAVCAGGALLPDIDHPHARASRLLGWLTGALCRMVRAMSAGVYRFTCTPADPDVCGKHRGLTHTLVFAGAVGALCTLVCNAWPVYGVVALFTLVVVLAEDAIPGTWVAPSAFTGALVWFAATPDPAAAVVGVAPWLGATVALGCVVHLLGDAVTESGVPMLAPLVKIDGQRWFRVGPPKVLRFPAGGACELLVVWPVLCGSAVVGVPGVWQLVGDAAAGVPGGRWAVLAVFGFVVAVRAAWRWESPPKSRRRTRRRRRRRAPARR